MKFTEDALYTRTTRRLKAVEGSEPMILPGMYGNKPGRVDSVTIAYTLNGRTGKWTWDHAAVHGVALKVDGTDSKSSFSSNVFGYYMKDNPERWQWLKDLIEQARPVSSPVFPSSYEGREFRAA
jgi:hypothetical protein